MPNPTHLFPCEYASDTQLAARYDVSRATIWRWVREGRLPPPVKLTPGCSRWRLSEVVQRLESTA